MIERVISSLMGRKGGFPGIRPQAPFAAIGDIHGRADLLKQLLARLDRDLPVVCVGDYIDRGDQSAEVLDLLRRTGRITCLKGNHEDMLLSFLTDPEKAGPSWLRNGGLQTLASYGVGGVPGAERGPDILAKRDALLDAMGPEMIAWLSHLPALWQSGNVAVVHAGADPAKALADQTERHLLWGHPKFARSVRKDGIWVVHGHTVVDHPIVEGGKVSIDTGAYATSCLTAAIISEGDVSFVSTA